MPIWHSGQAWRVVNSLNKLNEQIRAYAPRAVPPATDAVAWGSIADSEHSTGSDHYPHFYGALGPTAVVCARDFPNAPALGLDGSVVTEHMRQARDPRIGYIICNGRITGPNHGWRWDPYDGSDPHDTHFHVSSVHTAVADSVAAWSLPALTAQGADMTPAESLALTQVHNRVEALLKNADARVQSGTAGVFVPENNALADAVAIAGGAVVIDDATRAALAAAAGEAVKEVLGAAFEARLTAWANSPEGRAALVAAVNVAEDS